MNKKDLQAKKDKMLKRINKNKNSGDGGPKASDGSPKSRTRRKSGISRSRSSSDLNASPLAKVRKDVESRQAGKVL